MKDIDNNVKESKMQAKFIHFVGIDVSKKWIDVCVLINGDKSVLHQGRFEQNKQGFADLKKWLLKLTENQIHQLFICIENTGLYDDALLYFLTDKGFTVCLENAAKIKASIRDRRAKNDQLDARNIALYALRHSDELEVWQKPRPVVDQLKQLLAARTSLLGHLTSIKQAQKEIETFNWSKQKKIKNYQAGIKGLQKDIEQIEADIWELIKSDETLYKMFLLLISIPAIGKVTAYHFICYTNEFKRVKSGKNLSSYCGVVPFQEKSGTSRSSPARVSKEANRTLKKLLHLCALTALKMKGEFAIYYQRKIAEGKHVLKVINAIRNKLALRIAAVIRNQEPYNENYIYQQ
ncbi:MAG TPA: IS110 family transposase [Parafilimonas sp.]|nr:IS110 family transposase [Parafilimonas sp.]